MAIELVPRLAPASTEQLHALTELCRGRRLVALTGAGCSTESGIPDYRGHGTRERARNPIRFAAYVGDPSARARYWARSAVGWPKISASRPNAAHAALARLQRDGALTGLITQNVDRLHQAAGSEPVVELHGALAEVRCLRCNTIESRRSVQARLRELNPRWAFDEDVELAPDGDAELEPRAVFRVADCQACGGLLKPNVVFFGEQVSQAVVDRAYGLVDRAEVLLVLGSSLAVFSGLRFVRRAAKAGTPVVIVNGGPTRGDALATVTICARLGEVLPRLADALAG